MRYGLDLGNKLRKQEDRRRPGMLNLPYPLLDTVDNPEAVWRTELCYLILILFIHCLYTLFICTHPYVIHCLRSYNA